MRYFSPILLMKPYAEFPEGLMNWKIRFLNIPKLSELLIVESNLFDSINEDGKKVFLIERL